MNNTNFIWFLENSGGYNTKGWITNGIDIS